ncbi:MAG: hypothetical protein IKI66_09250 [Bacteroidales bacterium]|nr:hypothetical protein [Bacteroidales bacterium]
MFQSVRHSGLDPESRSLREALVFVPLAKKCSRLRTPPALLRSRVNKGRIKGCVIVDATISERQEKGGQA